jgi:glycine cleavage system aminomethyltransferase T
LAEAGERQVLFPNVRRSPYFELSRAEGARLYMVYNHMYMPIAYGTEPRGEYEALTNGVTLWDVAAERQTQLVGPDAVRLADYVCTRDLSSLSVGQCRYTAVCDPDGRIMTEPVVLMPRADTVWISHGDVDLTLWVAAIAIEGGYTAEVSEPDVAPMQLQGPRSDDVMAKLCPDATSVGYYRCISTGIGGIDCVVSQTGWSGERGYEIFALTSSEAPVLWQLVREAGREFDLLVTGPNLSRALEHGITDTHYYVNFGMDAFEAGRGRLVDLDHGPFVGQRALQEAAAREPRRRTVGLVGDDRQQPPLEEQWAVQLNRADVGLVLWAAWSFALGRAAAIALVDATIGDGVELTVLSPAGATKMTTTALPLVS